MCTEVGLSEDLQMQGIRVISLVCLTVTPLKIGSSRSFFLLPKPKRKQLSLAIIYLLTFHKMC